MNNEEAANVLRIMASGIELKGYTENWLSGFKEAYEMAIKVLEKRPQDEWIYLPSTKEYKCPRCENTCKCTTFPIFRYCPWCGSDNLGDDE